MNVQTLGKKINLRPSFVEHVEKRMQKFDRYFDDDAASAVVSASMEKDTFTAEITMKSRGLIYRAERCAPSLEIAFNDAADQIVKQIVKNKGKLGARIKKGQTEADLDAIANARESSVVREKHFAVTPMTTDEAVLQMEMLSHSFYMFKNAATGNINVVYRRNDGNYGVLVPLD